MSDANIKLIEMQQTNENFETNEPLNEHHSRQGSHFNLLNKVYNRSEEVMGSEIVKIDKNKLPKKRVGQKPERPTADGHPMQRLESNSLLDEEIEAEGSNAKQEPLKRSPTQVHSMIEPKSERGLDTNKGSQSSIITLEPQKGENFNSILVNSGPIINDKTSSKRLTSKKSSVKFGKVEVVDYSTNIPNSKSSTIKQRSIIKRKKKKEEEPWKTDLGSMDFGGETLNRLRNEKQEYDEKMANIKRVKLLNE